MLMALRYLTCYLIGMVQLIMIFLTTTVAVAANPIGLILAILLTLIAIMGLIRVTHPPAPPYRIVLLFRQVRIRLGLLPTLNYIDEDVAVKITTLVADYQTAVAIYSSTF